MIRVGFLHPGYGDRWLGGISYLANLFAALRAHPDAAVEPVLLAGPRTAVRAELAGVEVVRSPAVLLRHFLEARGLRRRFQADPFLDRSLRRHAIPVLSHSGLLGRRARTRVIAWIPDLQHRALPGFFSPAERALRDQLAAADLAQAERVVLSSEAARADLDRWFPGHQDRLRVVRFVSAPGDRGGPVPARADLEGRHGFRGSFLLLPNQYWAHKNHRKVLEALGLLASRGQQVQVVSTGTTDDYRNPGHFEGLLRLRAELGLEQHYRVLGLVPAADLAGLFRHAAAVVNPSRFEGWSTTVEEAKSLGKRLVLSDIPVHREQAPERALFFDPDSAEQLADALWSAWRSEDPQGESQAADRAAAAFPERQGRFAAAYAAVVREVAGP